MFSVELCKNKTKQKLPSERRAVSGAVCVHVQEFVVLCGDFVVTMDVRLDVA
jgi:hypothetical protein